MRQFAPGSRAIFCAFHSAAITVLVLLAGTSLAAAQDRTEDSGQSHPAIIDQDGAGEQSDKFATVDPPAVQRIVMHNSGLTQIVHSGTLEGNCRVEMNFSSHDVDDVLKSLVFEDRDGGVIRSVEYKPAPDATDVAAKRLGPAMTMAQTLQKYRGEKVTVTADGNELVGHIVSVENRQSGAEFVETLTLINDDGFVSIALTDASRIKFANEDLRHEFQKAMIGLAKSRTDEQKTLGLLFEGGGSRDIRFSYNVDAPIWRMTYRLDITNEIANVQGWAHIDNVTGVDWSEIELDLRSGRPQSFHVDLFAPVLAERASLGLSVFDLPSDRTLVSPYGSFDGYGNSGGYFGGTGPGRGGFGGGGFGGGSFGGGGFGGGGRPAEPLDINAGFQAAASAGRQDTMVQFKIKDPVSLQAGRSAMVPVIGSEIKCELFSRLSSQTEDQPAELLARLTNGTEQPLIPGPVAFYLQGEFMGDGVLERIEVGAMEGFVYGTDTPVTLKVDRSEPVVAIRNVTRNENEVRIEFDTILTHDHRITNRDSLARDVLLEIPGVHEQINPKPERIEDSTLHYTLKCGADAEKVLKVVQTDSNTRTLAISFIDESEYKRWKDAGATIEPGLETSLKRIFEITSQLVEIRSARMENSRRGTAAMTEQKRITGLLGTLESGTAVADDFVQKLKETEKQLDQSRQKHAELTREITGLEKRIQDAARQ